MDMHNLHRGKLEKTSISDAFWDRYIKLVTDQILPYQWDILNDEVADAEPSHCVHNFEIAAGRREGNFYGEVFQDTDAAKWLEAVAYSLSYKKDPELEKKADWLIDLIGEAQDKDGYLDTYFMLKAPNSRFRNLQQGHELYTAGHMMEAAVAYYHVTGKRKFLDIMEKNADLLCSVFRAEEYVNAIPGHEEVELGLIRMYEASGKRDYLEMAKEFVERRGRCPEFFAQEREHPDWVEIYRDLVPDDLTYAQCHKPVREQTEAVGHAVRAVYLYSAMADIAAYYQDESLLSACKVLYENIVNKRMYITGGIGSSGILERFTVDYDLPNASNYSESCASIGLALFARRMAQLTHDAKYADTMELALMNTVLAGISLDGKSFFYVNPLEVWPDNCLDRTSMRHVKPVRQKWFSCACCPPNIARTLASMAEYMWFYDNESLWLNLYISGKLETEISGIPTAVSVESAMPLEGRVRLEVVCPEKAEGTIALRVPQYAQNFSVTVNGKEAAGKIEKGYMLLSHGWYRDVIDIAFDMPAQFVYANTNVRADNGKVALKKGPLVYCLEEEDNGKNLSSLLVDTEKGIDEYFDKDILNGTVVLRVNGARRRETEGDSLYTAEPPVLDKAVLTYVPYCFWGNRLSGEMQVWTNMLKSPSSVV